MSSYSEALASSLAPSTETEPTPGELEQPAIVARLSAVVGRALDYVTEFAAAHISLPSRKRIVAVSVIGAAGLGTLTACGREVTPPTAAAANAANQAPSSPTATPTPTKTAAANIDPCAPITQSLSPNLQQLAASVSPEALQGKSPEQLSAALLTKVSTMDPDHLGLNAALRYVVLYGGVINAGMTPKDLTNNLDGYIAAYNSKYFDALAPKLNGDTLETASVYKPFYDAVHEKYFNMHPTYVQFYDTDYRLCAKYDGQLKIITNGNLVNSPITEQFEVSLNDSWHYSKTNLENGQVVDRVQIIELTAYADDKGNLRFRDISTVNPD